MNTLYILLQIAGSDRLNPCHKRHLGKKHINCMLFQMCVLLVSHYFYKYIYIYIYIYTYKQLQQTPRISRPSAYPHLSFSVSLSIHICRACCPCLSLSSKICLCRPLSVYAYHCVYLYQATPGSRRFVYVFLYTFSWVPRLIRVVFVCGYCMCFLHMFVGTQIDPGCLCMCCFLYVFAGTQIDPGGLCRSFVIRFRGYPD